METIAIVFASISIILFVLGVMIFRITLMEHSKNELTNSELDIAYLVCAALTILGAIGFFLSMVL